MLHPGDVATMDLRPGRYVFAYSKIFERIFFFLTNRVFRLNVHVNENDVIQNATCG